MPPAKRSRHDDAPASSTAADLHLLPGLEAAHAAARLAYWSDTYRAEVPSPTVLRGVLSAEEVAACCALASASGRRSEPTTAWRNPPPVCPALADACFDVVYTAEHVALFLHRDGLFADRCKHLLAKVVRAMREGGRVDPATELQVRCVELHSYSEGGALDAPLHRDSGSLLTLSVQLCEAGRFEGGDFVTFREGEPERHRLELGDGVLLSSMELHNVTRVTRGTRVSLVVELWSEPANSHDRFE